MAQFYSNINDEQQLRDIITRLQSGQRSSEHGGGDFQSRINAANAQLAKIKKAPAATAAAPKVTPLPQVTQSLNGSPTTSILDMINAYRNGGDINNLISDASDDPYIDEILSNQSSPFLGQLSQDRASGKVSGIGFDAAMAEYDRQRGAGRDTLSGIGSGVLAGGRQSLYDILNEAQSAAIKDPTGFNFDPYKQRVQDTAGTFKGSIKQKLMDAIGGTNYFDSAAAMGKIPAAQGSTNTPSGSILDALKGNTNAGAYKRPDVPQFGAGASSSPLAALLGNREKGFGSQSTGFTNQDLFRNNPSRNQATRPSSGGLF